MIAYVRYRSYWLSEVVMVLLSNTTYKALYDVIGTKFGTAGGDTFRVPDLRASFVRGWDDNRSIDDGRVFGSEQEGQLGPHSHVFEDINGTVAYWQKRSRRV